MRAPAWLLAAAFLAASLPSVLVLQALDIGGDYRLLIAMVLGAVASGLVQTWYARRKDLS